MAKRNIKSKIQRKMAETFKDSKDIILDASIIRITGDCDAIIENYKGLMEFDERKITVKANPYPISVKGQNLELMNISDEIVRITGEISAIYFIREV